MHEHRRDDLRLELTYAPQARDRVREMIRREQECCTFFGFGLREERDAIRLIIEAPEAAREAAEMVLEPSRSKTSIEAGCAG